VYIAGFLSERGVPATRLESQTARRTGMRTLTDFGELVASMHLSWFIRGSLPSVAARGFERPFA